MVAAAQGNDGRWAKGSLILGAIVSAAFLLVAVVGSSVLIKAQVDMALVLSLMSAFGLIDQALKLFPMRQVRMASGLGLGTIAMLLLFFH